MLGTSTRIAALLSISALAACASTESVFPQDAPTMRETYDRHFEGLRGSERPIPDRSHRERQGLQEGPAALAGYTLAAHREIEALFPRLPNPTLVMYVFPHLAGAEGVGVPGYATSFPMYERVHYALPGEVVPRYRPLGVVGPPPTDGVSGGALPARSPGARPLARSAW